MAAITTAGSGNWSSTTPNAPWPGGTLPTSADDVVIAKNHTVTLDSITAVANSVSLQIGTTTGDVGGILQASTSTNSKLVLQLGLTANGSATANYRSSLLLDMSSAYTYSCAIVLNNSRAAGGASLVLNGKAVTILKGYQKTRWTRVSGAMSIGATSCVVDDATGWQTGDRLVFSTTGTSAQQDTVTNVTVSGTSISWVGGTTYAHSDRCFVGNFSSNLKISVANAGDRGTVFMTGSGWTTSSRVLQDVLFEYLNDTTTFANYSISYEGGASGDSNTITRNAFWDMRGSPWMLRNNYAALPDISRSYNIYWMPNAYATMGGANNSNGALGTISNEVIFRYGGNSASFNTIAGIQSEYIYISGATGTASVGTYSSGHFVTNHNIHIWGTSTSALGGALVRLTNSSFGTMFSGSTVPNIHYGIAAIESELISCSFGVSGNFYQAAAATTLLPSSFTKVINKNNDTAQHEIYTAQSSSVPAIKRDNSIYQGALSSICMTCTTSNEITYRFELLAKASTALKILVWMKKSGTPAYGTATLPSIKISGLDITQKTASMSSGTAADTWELVSLDLTSMEAPTSSGMLTITLTAQSATSGANAYFSGLPVPPFILGCRHYGFLLDETIPTRTVDPYSVASEATASAYTGVTINNTSKEISFASGTADTAQKFYDYHQATICANLGYDVAISRAGTLYSLLSTWTVVDPLYSGTLTWSGGTVKYTSSGTKADNLDGCIVELDNVGVTLTGTLSGTLDLRNLGASAITVEVPAGTTYTTANNTGGTITVQEPQTYQSVTLSGGVAGSRVQLYDVTSSTELYNDVPGAWPFTWTDSSPYAADREIRLRIMWVSGASAKEFIDQTIGTCTETSAALSYLIAQADDTVYNANGIDGSALTGYSITGSNLTIDIDDGTATWPEMYAYEVYWLSTEDGIRDQDLYIQATDTANYVFYGGFKIKNTSSPTQPLLITGGNGEPSSGPATDLLDTSGGTIFCNSATVVPYSSGAEATIAIVQSGLTAQGYTGSRATKIDNLDAAITQSGVSDSGKQDIAAAILAAAQTMPIHADIQRIRSQELQGAGSEADPWSPAP